MNFEEDNLIISAGGEQSFRELLTDEASHKRQQAVNAELGQPEKGLAKLVLTLIELLRRLLEQEALRQIDRNQLTDLEIERLGSAFEQLDQRMHELLLIFGLDSQDLNLDLGPLGRIL